MRVQKHFNKPSRTRSEFKEECDINRVMARFEKTGLVEHLAQSPGRYGDVTNLPDFHEAQNIVIEAKSLFAELPARVRKQFGNDPGEFVEFAQDPENLDQLRAWGLADMPDTAQPPERSSGNASAEAPGGPQGAPDGGGAPEST